MTATASGGTNNYGVYNYFSSSPTMTNVTATASGGTYSYGVCNIISSSPAMTDVTATGSGGTYNYGVYNNNSSTAKIDHSVITGSTYTVYVSTSSAAYIVNTRLDGGAVGGSGGAYTCAGVCDETYTFYANTCP